MAAGARSHGTHSSGLPRVSRGAIKGGLTHGVAAVMGKVQSRGGVVHVGGCHLIIIGTPVLFMVGPLVHPVLTWKKICHMMYQCVNAALHTRCAKWRASEGNSNEVSASVLAGRIVECFIHYL